MTTGNSPPPPPNAKPKTKQKGNILTSILSLSTVPYSSYVPEPKTFLHNASAEVKQLWIIAILILISRGSTSLRLIITGIIALATIIALPPRIWKPQLIRLAGITGLIFVFTAIGSDGVPPVLVNRSLPPITSETTASVLAASDAFKSSAIQSIGSILPQSMNEVAPKAYRYVMFHLGPITITKRSVALATALATVTFAALQSASLCLVTTPPERMAAAVGKALKPFGWVGVPVKELVLTVLLSLRFMAMVFEEGRNLALGIASRGIEWSQLGTRGTIALVLSSGARLFTNLMARCNSIATAMSARGFKGPEEHILHVAGGAAEPGLRLMDAVLLLSIGGLIMLSKRLL